MSISNKPANNSRLVIYVYIGILIGLCTSAYIILYVKEPLGARELMAAKIGFILFVIGMLSNLTYKLVKKIKS